MSDKSMEFSQFMSPDSLRKATQLLKNMYDLHTKRYCGYEDINGCQYVGTVENFGSEMLFETRKLLMNKPPLKNIFIENTFDFYFDIQYSEIINTYDQQNMLCAVLRKDVLLSDKEYCIKFNDVEIVNIPRAQSWSDPIVYKDPYIKTKIPPILCIKSSDGSIEEMQLILSDETDVDTTYFFRLYDDMTDMYSDTYEEIITNKTITTLPITDKMNGLPFIWMTVNKLSTLPDIGFVNNILYNSQFLTIGTNGHNISMVYPALNIAEDDIDYSWIIKAIPNESSSFIEDENAMTNYECLIKEIHLLKYDKDNVDLSVEPLEDLCITYDDTYSKMTLTKIDGVVIDNVKYIGKWFFKKPLSSDYDYDKRTYRNPCYAYTALETFHNNFVKEELISYDNMIAGFQVHFKMDYVDMNDALCQNVVSGVHVDFTSDHSDNSVSKKNGVIHDLGDFNGLPKYFSYMIKDTIHRAHIEAYSIRDGINRSKSSIDKQTAGIIIDSAIPQNELNKVTSDMPISIQFDWNDQINRRYITIDENASISNSVTEITFADSNTFGNSKIAKYSLNDKFVYHGNRTFSLGIIGLDPELEVGRVYIISNDKIVYENNEVSSHKKPPTTFARICDIPTKYSQLINIKGIAPTLVIDEDYVRTEACFYGNRGDKEILYNQTNRDHIMVTDDYVVFPETFDMSTITNQMISERFSKYIHLNDIIEITDRNFVEYEIDDGGTGYNVDDIFSFYIGGIRIKGIVKTVDEGVVTAIAYLYTKESTGETIETDYPQFSAGAIYIPRSSLKQSQSYDTDNISSNGVGLTIRMTINEVWWEQTAMTTDGILNDIFLFKLDHFGNIWAYKYSDGTWIQDTQISGIQVHDNLYDDMISRNDRNIKNVLLYNNINQIQRIVNSFEIYTTTYFIPTIEKSEDIFSDKDFSIEIEQAYRNIQNGIFFLIPGLEASKYHNIVSFEIGHVNYEYNDLIIPAYHDLNLPSYVNKSNKLFIYNNEDVQPSLFIFDPNINTIDTKTTVHRDLEIIESSRALLFSDVFASSPDTPDDIINQKGILSRNIYYFDEYSTEDRDLLREQLNAKSTESLLSEIESKFNDSIPIKYQGTKNEYSREMLIDYIMENTLYHNRTSYVYRDTTDVKESIYRRPNVKILRHIGDRVVDNGTTPVGKQPSGGFRSITTERFDPKVKMNNIKYNANPLYIFRIDNDEEVISLKDFRMYDDMDNDISRYTMLIVNDEIYIANIVDDNIDWIKVERGV